MEITPSKKFSSPEEEIAFLRQQIAQREQVLLERNRALDATDRETVGRRVMREYSEFSPEVILESKHKLPPETLHQAAENLVTSGTRVEEILRLTAEKGIRNALSVLEKLGDSYLTDEVHKRLIQEIRNQRSVSDLKEGMPMWRVLHMTLFEVSLPQNPTEDNRGAPLTAIFSAMEQFYSGMQTLTGSSEHYTYALEVAVSDKRDEIIFYVAVPNEYVNLFEKQALSLFPHAVLIEQQNDYNIFVEGGTSLISVGTLRKHPLYPLRTHDEFEKDPLAVILNAFSKIERDGGGAALQLIISSGKDHYKRFEGVMKRVQKGEPADVAIRRSTLSGEMLEEVKGLFFSKPKDKEEKLPEIDSKALEAFGQKLATPLFEANIRIAVSASVPTRADQILREIESSFHQFEDVAGNRINFKALRGGEAQREFKAFSFREFLPTRSLTLSQRELATIVHFPSEGLDSTPQFKQSKAKQAPAPLDLPQHGTLLGENEFRNVKTKVYLTPEDRVRHFYVIGQTGTGKTTILKNMIIQDIREGSGVCMIDPHGTDLVDILSAIPPERADDLIYFEPARLDRVIGLNMLEFDPRFPEQKTFVVNELFSIFQKLYGANPESMGPMFEQYFRNATLLVLEDPESGSTLLDISRVMADAQYRRYKLSKATNPVVLQFWNQIASKAGGEASLENIVPYIVSKFDVFTANDYMRPIIGQQKSSFNFRQIMDEKKILLVNLSKGRLGEINANLIGMIIVGKFLMAALSRVDDITRSLPPFHLYIDEFQNVTTNSIAAILSEARKYKLTLNIAHQFIAQLDQNIKDAVFGNVGSMAVYRTGPEDAAFLEKQFAPTFTASDLMNVENFNAYLRILVRGTPTTPFSIKVMKPEEINIPYAEELIEFSLLKHGTPRDEVEAAIRTRYKTP